MKFVAYLCVLAFLTSCSQERYLHSAAPVLNPMLKEKSDGFVSIQYSNNNSGNGSETTSGGAVFQGAYAFTDHIGMAGSFWYQGEKDIYEKGYSSPFDQSTVKYRRTEASLAFDYFLASTNKKNGLNLLFGATTGKLKLTDFGKLSSGDYNRYFNTNNFQLFLQPSFNIYSIDNTGLGFTMKLNYVNYYDTKTNYTLPELNSLTLKTSTSMFLSEFGIKIKVGFKAVPMAIEMQSNYILAQSDEYILSKRLNLSIGASYNFSKKKSK